MLYQIDQVASNVNHAGSKARNDCAEILSSMGFKSLRMSCTLSERPWDIFKDIVSLDLQFKKLLREMEPGSTVVVQFPYRCFMTRSGKAMRQLADAKRIKCVALVHDIDSLRRENAEDKIGHYTFAEKLHCDCLFLQNFDFVISHNERMTNLLVKSGIARNKMINLELFDYLTKQPNRSGSGIPLYVSIAGNLGKSKAGYLYELHEALEGTPVHFDLFGNGYTANSSEAITYRGSVAPDELPNMLPSGYGLVWDGPSIESCKGVYGNYLRYNNPHKLSLYYASGLVPIVWSESAAAEFVQHTNSGLIVGSLKSIPTAISSLGADECELMKSNAHSIGAKVRAGYYLQKAIKTICPTLRSGESEE